MKIGIGTGIILTVGTTCLMLEIGHRYFTIETNILNIGKIIGRDPVHFLGIISQLKDGLDVRMFMIIHIDIMTETRLEKLLTMQVLTYLSSADLDHWETFRGGESPPPGK